jgi:DNA-binding NtrC family response regulator
LGGVLIIDDQRDMCESLEMLFRMEGFDVTSTTQPRAGASIAADMRPDVVLTDMRMEGFDGIELLKAIKKVSPATEVIIMTAYATIDSAVQAMRLGAFDYITKPFKNEAILAKIRRATVGQRPQREVHDGADVVVIAESAQMRVVKELAGRLATTSMPVLITGETGTGKSLLAQQIHVQSTRSAGPFVHVNCSALPEHLIESELFGHQKGAFTGAVSKHRGLFQNADRGTIFLDEISLLPMSQQPKLLLALENRMIRPIGSEHPVPVDVRVIAATNSDLQEQVHRGAFRQDLYYRLNAATIHVPPIRERREDVVALAALALSKYGNGETGRKLGPDAVDALLAYDFPGNAREIDNAMHWACAVATGEEVTAADLPPVIRSGSRRLMTADRHGETTLREVSRQAILDCVGRHDGNLARAAKELGIGRTTLWRRLKEYGMN